MTISTEQILMVIGSASTITTAIFWGAFQLGRLHSRMTSVENTLDRAGKRMSDLADEVQKFPTTYLTRSESIGRWHGSRAEDQ